MLSRVFVGDEIRIPQLCGDYFMSHGKKKGSGTLNNQDFNGKVRKCVVFFDRGSHAVNDYARNIFFSLEIQISANG